MGRKKVNRASKKTEAKPVSDEQQKNIELTLSTPGRSVWKKVSQSDDTGDSHQETASRG
jgi:hypothetical protein